MLIDGVELVTSTTLSDFQFCPRFYQLRYEEGYVSPAINIPLVFGEWVHFGLKTLYESKWDAGKACLAFGEGFAKYQGMDKRRSLEKGVNLLVQYSNQFKDDAEKWTDLTTEVYFEVGLEDGINFGGTIDLTGKFCGEWTIAEHKTSSWPNFFVVKPNNQVSGYTWGAQSLLGKPFPNALVNILPTTDKVQPILRHLTSRTKSDITEFAKGTLYWAKQIQLCRQNGEWPMISKDHARYNKLCEYLSICSLPKASREGILEMGFKKEFYNPRKVKGQ